MNSGFTLAPPSSTIDSDRPAYGGTCYSGFDLGAVATVTVYNTSALSTTELWTASTTPAQAYAHPIDGIALDYTPTASSSGETSATKTAGYTGGASTSTSESKAAGLCRGELRFDIGITLLVASIVGVFV